jgi:two-component system cell cycle response regulator DivK
LADRFAGYGGRVPGAADRPRILIVDDFDDARELYCELFAGQGFEVHSAGDGITALELAKSLLPDVILLDIALPRLDGLSVLSAVRSHPPLSATRVVMLTAHTADHIKTRAISLGASGIIIKPCLPEDLLGAVHALLSKAL